MGVARTTVSLSVAASLVAALAAAVSLAPAVSAQQGGGLGPAADPNVRDRKSTRLNSSH